MKLRVCLLLGGFLAFTAGSSLSAAGSYAAPAATSRQTRPPTSAYQQGVTALSAGHYSAAENDFRQAIARHDHVAQAWVGIAAADFARREYSASYHAMLHAVQLRPRDPGIQYRTASSALYSDDFHAAVKYATNYIALEPRDPRGFQLRFNAYGNLLDRKHQLQDARSVVKLQPHNANAYNDLGIALANNKEFSASEVALTRAIALQPSNPEFYSNRAQPEYQQKQYNKALADLEKALSLTKDRSRRGQLTAAIAYLRKQIHH